MFVALLVDFFPPNRFPSGFLIADSTSTYQTAYVASSDCLMGGVALNMHVDDVKHPKQLLIMFKMVWMLQQLHLHAFKKLFKCSGTIQ